MATVNKNCQIKTKASNGDIVKLYPDTKIANVEGLQTSLDAKVDKISGKGLSTNDYTTTEKNKLAGIADGATANIGTVTGVKVGSTSYSPSSGIVSLPAYPTTLPASDVSSWAKASSKPSYTASEVGAIATTAKGAASGVAELDANGKVPSSQLPSYVDDVLEYSAQSSFPSTGETGKIYVDTSTNKTYRWSGSAYVEISPSLALGTTSSTAYRGDRGNTAYSHATDSSRLTTAQSSGLYKIATTAQGHIASVTAVAKSDITGLGIPGSDTNTHRPIQVNGTQVLGDNTTALNLKAGSNVSLSNSSGTVTIAATDTTYSAATQSANGLMSSTDKTKLDGIATGATANIGTVTQVKVGSTAYNPSSGVISLPAYPSDTNTHRPIQMNGTEILGNNTTALNLKAGSNVSLSNSSGTVTIAATDTTYSAATQSANGLMSSTDKTKLDGIATGANNYTHPTSSGNKHIPSGGSSGQILRWSADGTAAWGSDNNTWTAMVGATSSANGSVGYVNAVPPKDGYNTKYLRADGTWAVPPDNNTTYSAATQSAAGLMSAADKTKLDGIATGANNYSLPNATTSSKGGVIVGSNLSVSNGTISMSSANVASALGYTPANNDGVNQALNTRVQSQTYAYTTSATSKVRIYKTANRGVMLAIYGSQGGTGKQSTILVLDVQSGILSVRRLSMGGNSEVVDSVTVNDYSTYSEMVVTLTVANSSWPPVIIPLMRNDNVPQIEVL